MRNRRTRWLLAFAASSGAVALAGCDGKEYVFGPNWSGPQESAKNMSFYPPAALRREQPGIVVLNCFMHNDGRLDDCKTVYEAPKGWGFGDAAQKMYSSIVIRMTEAEMVSAQAEKTHFRVQQPVSFCFDKRSCEETHEAWQRLGLKVPSVLPPDFKLPG